MISRTTWGAAHPALGSCFPCSSKAPGLPTHTTWGEQQNNPITDPQPWPHGMSTTTKHSDRRPCVRQHLLYWKQSMKLQVLSFSLLWSSTHHTSRGRAVCPQLHTHQHPNPTPDSRKHCSQAHINSTQAFNPTWHICEQFKLTQQHLRHSKTLEIR